MFQDTSHPTRVRGLKQGYHLRPVRGGTVAPYTGAWIETLLWTTYGHGQRRSHPTRVRGLKPVTGGTMIYLFEVAPYTGAWIETRTTYP